MSWLTKYQNGGGYNINNILPPVKQEPLVRGDIPTTYNIQKDPRLINIGGADKAKAELAKTIADRRARIAASKQVNKKGLTNMTAQDWATSAAAIPDEMRISEQPNFIDDSMLNPLNWLGSMSSELGQSPYKAQQQHSMMPVVQSVAAPITGGFLGSKWGLPLLGKQLGKGVKWLESLGTKEAPIEREFHPLDMTGFEEEPEEAIHMAPTSHATAYDHVPWSDDIKFDLAERKEPYKATMIHPENGQHVDLAKPGPFSKMTIKDPNDPQQHITALLASSHALPVKYPRLMSFGFFNNNPTSASQQLKMFMKKLPSQVQLPETGSTSIHSQPLMNTMLERMAGQPGRVDIQPLTNQGLKYLNTFTKTDGTSVIEQIKEQFPKIVKSYERLGKAANVTFDKPKLLYNWKEVEPSFFDTDEFKTLHAADPMLENLKIIAPDYSAVKHWQYGGQPIVDPRGQWAHPGKVTRIPSPSITMQGVGYPVLGKANNGKTIMMQPGQDYHFGNATYVDEYPMMQKGGTLPPYITNNPNDPRLKAYQDSSLLYNNYVQVLNALKQQKYKQEPNLPGKHTIYDYLNEKDNGININKVSPTLNSADDFIHGIVNKTLPAQLYSETIKPNGIQNFVSPIRPTFWNDKKDPRYGDRRVIGDYSNVNPKQEVFYQQPTASKPTIKKVDKKPVQPVLYNPEIHSLGQQQPLTAEQVGLVHPQDFQFKMINPAMVNTIPNIQPVGNKPPTPTNYVATWRDESMPDKTAKKYFQNVNDWRNFVYNNPEYSYISAEETGNENGQPHSTQSAGYLQRKQKGGWLSHYN